MCYFLKKNKMLVAVYFKKITCCAKKEKKITCREEKIPANETILRIE